MKHGDDAARRRCFAESWAGRLGRPLLRLRPDVSSLDRLLALGLLPLFVCACLLNALLGSRSGRG